ncbi:hypothetical protein [Domibacillus epiphyticus]|uniref:Uncharacterized protein n=1 Tax=Domibacillus epiphyticus TaxID=1714355 RepID=A0A1V2A5S4_9BACI|nr:hypothetical protein [Domibacillus epiphyticus]OMP66343.1 hypothetical protein BTO28_12850 [Domibacillus epiphyticus]
MPFYPPNPGSGQFQPYPQSFKRYPRTYQPPYQGPFQSYSPPSYRNPGPGYPEPRYTDRGINPFQPQEGLYQQRPGMMGNLNQIVTTVGDISNGINAIRQMGTFFNRIR